MRLSDAKAWLIKLQRDGRGYSTIHTVRGVVRPAFQMAVDVKECFRKIMENRKKPRLEPVVYDKNGTPYEGFSYLDKNDIPMVAMHWENTFSGFVRSITAFIKWKCPKSHLMYADIPFAPIWRSLG